MGSNYGPVPVHGPNHRHLEVFVGTWRAEGQAFGRNQDPLHPRANPEPWTSYELTEWHPGRFFIIQREDAMSGGQPLNTVAVIGFDAQSGMYVAHAFENHGYANRYIMQRDDRTWTLVGERARHDRVQRGRPAADRALGVAPHRRSMASPLRSDEREGALAVSRLACRPASQRRS